MYSIIRFTININTVVFTSFSEAFKKYTEMFDTVRNISVADIIVRITIEP